MTTFCGDSEIALKDKTKIILKINRITYYMTESPSRQDEVNTQHSVDWLPKKASHLRDFLSCSCKKKFTF